MSLFFATRRRLVFGEGVYALAILTAILLAIFREVTDRLIPLYAVGAFMAFTLSQAGMVAHWKRVGGPGAHKGMFLNGLGASATAITVAIVLVAKFTEGAWITLVLIPAMILMMSVIKRHYGRVEKETQTDRSPCIAPPPIPVLPERGGTQLRAPRAVVLVDTREQTPFDFSRFSGWFARVEKKALKVGDYTIAGLEDICAVERKDLADLIHLEPRFQFSRPFLSEAIAATVSALNDYQTYFLETGKRR